MADEQLEALGEKAVRELSEAVEKFADTTTDKLLDQSKKFIDELQALGEDAVAEGKDVLSQMADLAMQRLQGDLNERGFHVAQRRLWLALGLIKARAAEEAKQAKVDNAIAIAQDLLDFAEAVAVVVFNLGADSLADALKAWAKR